MHLTEFAVERYFSKYEFTAKYMLSSSDCDGYSLNYVVGLANDNDRNRWDNLCLGYTETVGSEFLRMSIKQHSNTIQLDEIFVSSPGEANFILMNVLLTAGDHVVCMSPSYAIPISDCQRPRMFCVVLVTFRSKWKMVL